MTEIRPPNIFVHAQKELSQDAMICYLLEWAASKYRALDASLSDTGRRLVQALLGKHGASLSEEVKTVEVRKQDHRIDVLACINGSHILLIEDKTGGKQRGDQLRRYYNAVRDGKTGLKTPRSTDPDRIFTIFLKTGNYTRTDRASVENTELDGTSRRYRFFDRGDLLEVLSGYQGDDRITTDYRDYLQEREDRTQSYRTWQRSDRENWSWESWEGFYRHLEERLPNAGWGYVPNQSGGFLGLWWHWLDLTENGPAPADGFLQVEAKLWNPTSQHLCFKVGARGGGREAQVSLKPAWHQRLMDAGGAELQRPRRLGLGNTMTLAIWSGDWISFRSDGSVDLDATIRHLRHAESLWDAAVRSRQ